MHGGVRNTVTRVQIMDEVVFVPHSANILSKDKNPFPDKQGTPEEDRKIQRPKRCVTTKNNKDKDNNPKKNTHTKYCTLSLF